MGNSNIPGSNPAASCNVTSGLAPEFLFPFFKYIILSLKKVMIVIIKIIIAIQDNHARALLLLNIAARKLDQNACKK